MNTIRSFMKCADSSTQSSPSIVISFVSLMNWQRKNKHELIRLTSILPFSRRIQDFGAAEDTFYGELDFVCRWLFFNVPGLSNQF